MADTQQYHTTTHHTPAAGTMASTQQQHMGTLKEQIDTSAQKAQEYLDTLKTNVHAYDTTHPSSDKASDALRPGINTAQSSVDELKRVTAKLSTHSTETSNELIEEARAALANVKTSLNALQTSAREYDAKLTASGTTGGSITGGTSVSVESIANTTRERTNDAIELVSAQLARMRDMAANALNAAGRGVQVAAGEALLIGDKIDAKLGVSSTASSAAGAVSNTAADLDRRMQVSNTAANADQQYMGGTGANIVNKGAELMQGSVGYVSDAMQQARIAASKSSSAQAADQQAAASIDSASATVHSAACRARNSTMEAMDSAKQSTMATMESAKQSTMNAAGNAKDQVVCAACNARDATLETAESAKKSAMNAVGMNSNKPLTDEVAYKTSTTAESMKQGARETAGAVQQKGYELAGSAQQTATSMKHSAQDTAASAQQKGYELAGSAQQKGNELAGSAQQTATSMKHSAQDTAASAQQKGYELAGSAQQKGHELAGSAQQKATSAKETAQEKAASAHQTGYEMAGSAHQKGHEMKEAAKDSTRPVNESSANYNTDESVKVSAKDVTTGKPIDSHAHTTGVSGAPHTQKIEIEVKNPATSY